MTRPKFDVGLKFKLIQKSSSAFVRKNFPDFYTPLFSAEIFDSQQNNNIIVPDD